MIKNLEKLKICATSFVVILVVLTTLFFSGCIDGVIDEPRPVYYFYSFDQGMEGWIADGTDLLDPPINWSIERSDDRSTIGNYSIKLYLDNKNDAGKIWMERSFELTPNTEYEINISYDFGTRDWGDVNLFRIITGASATSPENATDLTFQDDTGNHQNEDVGYIWMNKSYTVTAQTNDEGIIYVFIGVWGTWTTSRTYYVDSINISCEQISLIGLSNVFGL